MYTACRNCINSASREILNTCNSKDAIIWYEHCQIRYSFQMFFSTCTMDNSGKFPDHDNYEKTVTSNQAQFEEVLNYLTKNLVNETAYGSSKRMFATEEVKFSSKETIYGLSQCTRDMAQASCYNCLEEALGDLRSCCSSKQGGIVLSKSCNVRFEMYRFYNTDSKDDKSQHAILQDLASSTVVTITQEGKLVSSEELQFMDLNTLRLATDNFADSNKLGQGLRFIPSKEPNLKKIGCQRVGIGRKWSIWITASFVVSAFLAAALLGSFVYCLKMKIQSPLRKILRQDIISQELPLHSNNDQSSTDNFLHQHLQERDDQKGKELPFDDLASIVAATDNFSESNILGQGGFGPVYKGKLSDGKEIAVKRLSSCSHQGSQEFTNEVLLIMKLQHKNLVRLLGFCVNGEEKLLVYEFMTNGSLDVILFDPTKRAQLNWTRRLNITNGIARGMLYLHEDSRLRIIHRDLKASNILLDSSMDPKISDFGMARIFVDSEGEASTCRLVGTYGYMAPEYAMEGVYSVKSDVFSFGVLLLEIITGTRNAGFQQSQRASSLVSYAWQLWNEGKPMELMDPTMADSCCPDEFIKCVCLGLLCVQEDAFERPTMSAVMVMLKGGSEALRQPAQPAFSWGITADYYDEINVDSLSFDKLKISTMACLILALSMTTPVTVNDHLLTVCKPDTPITSTQLQHNLNTILESLPSKTSQASGYFNITLGVDPDDVQGQALCRRDVDSATCQKCLENATQRLKNQCKGHQEAMTWFELCQARYSSRMFISMNEYFGQRPKQNDERKRVLNPKNFAEQLTYLMHNISHEAAFNTSKSMFAAGEIYASEKVTIYGLVQCGAILSGSCTVRFELFRFFNASSLQLTNSRSEAEGTGKKWMIVAGSCTLLALGVLVAGSYAVYLRWKKGSTLDQEVRSDSALLHHSASPSGSAITSSVHQLVSSEELPVMDLATIRTATNDFADINKLGQGGFGSVFKGVLTDGKEVAVKRLSMKSWQGLEEFKNELVLIAKLQHRNLVRLLGCSMEGEEKLLIYEFMPNKSLMLKKVLRKKKDKPSNL
ncbi:hypothetical protein FNV43_RR07753 [Rhamnella rubrinervis]|uniref:non-specific serine/threonine protein kinase n=1 Tax=Rhamnella rubrinervis TaxID=2594499 RepID=A0A8K0MMN1_9ROSA|nr:hypothetical protein FNV43_RR07753 [Rhamnella rubrinervis]